MAVLVTFLITGYGYLLGIGTYGIAEEGTPDDTDIDQHTSTRSAPDPDRIQSGGISSGSRLAAIPPPGRSSVMSMIAWFKNRPMALRALTSFPTVLAVPPGGEGTRWISFQRAGSIEIDDRNGRTPLIKGDITMYAATSWGYRHRNICTGVRIAAGTWNVVLGSLLISHGYRWGVALYVTAALIFWAAYLLRRPARPKN